MTRTRLWDTRFHLLWDSDRDAGTPEEFVRARGGFVHCTIDRDGGLRWSGRLEVTDAGVVERNLDLEYVRYLATAPNPFLPSLPGTETFHELERRQQKARLAGDFGWPRAAIQERDDEAAALKLLRLPGWMYPNRPQAAIEAPGGTL